MLRKPPWPLTVSLSSTSKTTCHIPRPPRPPRSLSLSQRRRQRWHWASLPSPRPRRAGSSRPEALAPTPPWLCPLQAGFCSSVTSSNRSPGAPPTWTCEPGPHHQTSHILACVSSASTPSRRTVYLHPTNTKSGEKPHSPADACPPCRGRRRLTSVPSTRVFFRPK